MEKIQFDICNGLDKIALSNSGTRPIIEQGMAVVLLLNEAEIHVSVDEKNKNGDIYFGEVLEIEQQSHASDELNVGDKVSFTIENIAYPLAKDNSIK